MLRRTLICALAVSLYASNLSGCKSADQATAQLPFTDDFDRTELGPNWWASGGHWEIKDGQVFSNGANNAPLFLKVDLPADLVVEFDSTSDTKLVDTKLELMTDGRAHQSGYIFILGGWKNEISCIARLDEHGADRLEKKPTGVKGPSSYHWRVEKKGGSIRWFINGQPYMNFDDAAPLDPPKHSRLAFSNWQNQIHYDNLRIWPYDKAPPMSAGAVTSTTGSAQ